jgi:L-ascorbate metabolism protein UlaG (beta-lactamase superfamily)
MTPPASDHFNGKTFFQPGATEARTFRDFLCWRLTHRPTPWPRSVALSTQTPPPTPHGNEIVATWIGHATFLIQSAQGNLLLDPVFSERVSPLKWIGPRRVHPPQPPIGALPRLDAICVSHDHYDHFDAASLRWLARRHREADFIAPLRHRDLLTATGAQHITELDWWQTHTLAGGVSITFTPTKHWTNRLGTRRNHRLWGGFFVRIGERTVWFVGDSGYDKSLFHEIQTRLGRPDLALVPIGAYEPRWFMAPLHMNPAEAVRLHVDIGARLSIGMHWGTFQLTDEGREEPVRALAAARAAAGVSEAAFRVITPGESVVV